ncbi:ribonuclease H-like domain-containing protein [Tanacetum coccineum]
MPRVESIRPSGVIIEDWVSNDEDIFQSNNLQATDKPSFKRIEFTNARNESVKPKQAEKPRINTQNPKNTGQREIRPVWNSAQRINHQNKFVPSVVLTKFGRVPVSATKKSSLRATTSTSTFRLVNTATHTNRVNVSKLRTYAFSVNGVNTAGQTAVSAVKGNRVTAVKASAGNKDFLIDYQDIDGGFVAFGGSARGVAKRKNMTLIEAAMTMLADSLLPTVFWDEAVNTACYVLNRVLVTKPHNKTPFELITGRPPSISFMRPFGCPVTILNTLDPLGKFDGKAEEGFLVRYSVNSKAFRGTKTSLLTIKTLMEVLLLLVEVIEMVKIHTDNNVADLLTKAFDGRLMVYKCNGLYTSAIWIEVGSVERAITTAASLDAAQDSDNIIRTQTTTMPNVDIPQGMDTGGSPRRQDTIGGAPAQTRSARVLEQPIKLPLSEGHTSRSREGRMEHQFALMANVPITPHDSPLPGGYTPGSDDGRLKLQELMTMCTKLSKQVLDLEKEKDAQAVEILRLKKRVKRLETQRKSSTSQPRRRKYNQVESSDDDLNEGEEQVHTLFMDGTPMEINMLIEKKYQLIKELLEKMLNLQLEAEEESTMAFELIKFIKSMLEE